MPRSSGSCAISRTAGRYESKKTLETLVLLETEPTSKLSHVPRIPLPKRRKCSRTALLQGPASYLIPRDKALQSSFNKRMEGDEDALRPCAPTIGDGKAQILMDIDAATELPASSASTRHGSNRRFAGVLQVSPRARQSSKSGLPDPMSA
jgi:hypothetical protein